MGQEACVTFENHLIVVLFRYTPRASPRLDRHHSETAYTPFLAVGRSFVLEIAMRAGLVLSHLRHGGICTILVGCILR
jgi:hypothetical protein